MELEQASTWPEFSKWCKTRHKQKKEADYPEKEERDKSMSPDS